MVTQRPISPSRTPTGSRSLLDGWRRRLWPVVTVLAFVGVAWYADRTVYRGLRDEVEKSLTTILKADVEALTIWLEGEKSVVAATACQPHIRQLLSQLIEQAQQRLDGELVELPASRAVLDELAPLASSRQLRTLFVTDRSGRILIDATGQLTGSRIPSGYSQAFAELLTGNTTVIAPHACWSAMPDRHGELQAELPVILIAGPIHDQQQVVGSLNFVYDPGVQFTELLSVARSGNSGETYAVDASGLMLSESRFESELRAAGLLADNQSSSLKIAVRNPGFPITERLQSMANPLAQPMTAAAAGVAAASQSAEAEMSYQPQPFRDYRGEWVVGAWQWLPEYQFGVITEVDYNEAFALLLSLRWLLWLLLSLLGATLGVAISYSALNQIARKRLRRAEKKLERLGQYSLLDKIGEGGMGQVYRARHALLKRDTAIKLLRPDVADPAAIARFEREVQATSRLTHPCTIQIYDYGNTPEGLFYYAMEFLHGMNLSDLVGKFGPLTDGRVIHLLKQVCSALAEAHAAGLIHRDIKPSNLIVCQRGGIGDFIKVVDFGLVRSLGDLHASLTIDGGVTGTPSFMSPEAARTPLKIDARSDIYSLGCVAYFLLTGQPPFAGQNPIEICWKQTRDDPPPLAGSTATPAAPALERLILQALAKEPDARPASMHDLLAELSKVTPLKPWTEEDALQWWREHADPPPASAEPSD